MVPTAANWSDWVGVMVTSHFGLVLGLLWAPRGPKRARFGPKMPFWGPWRSWEGHRGPDLVPTAANWSDWVGVMVTSHFGLILGLLWAKKGLFWPIIALMGPKRAHLGPKFQIVLNLSSDPSKHAREGHSADEKNFVPIWFTSSEKIPKNYQLWQFRNFCEFFLFFWGGCDGLLGQDSGDKLEETYSPSFLEKYSPLWFFQ